MERLKQKVASSSSRVLASLQQVAQAGQAAAPNQTGESDNQAQVGAQDEAQVQAQAQTQAQAQAQAQVHLHAHLQAPRQTQAQAQGDEAHEPAGQLPQVLPEAAMSTAWLMAADATAHLTDEERGILLEVFKKEEQFQRDTIKEQQQQQQQEEQLARQQKRQAGAKGGQRAAGRLLAKCRPPARTPRPDSGTPTGRELARASDCASASSSSGSSGSSGATPAQAYVRRGAGNQCRICRKTIGASEPCHLCSNCQQFICDDCASYSSVDKHWMCSSCRRRALNPAIAAEALKELGLNQNSSAVRRMTLRLSQNELKLALDKKAGATNAAPLTERGASCAGTPTGVKTPPGKRPAPRPQALGLLPGQRSLDRPAGQEAAGAGLARPGSLPADQGQRVTQLKQREAVSGATGSLEHAATGRPSYCELRAAKLGAQKTLSQPTPEPSGPTRQASLSESHARPSETKRKREQLPAATGSRGSFAALQQPQWQPQSRPQPQSQQATYAGQQWQQMGGQARQASDVHAQQQSQQQQQQHHYQHGWPTQQLQQQQAAPEVSYSVSSSPLGSRHQSSSQLLQHHHHNYILNHQLAPGELVHTRRLSDQSMLVRRSSITGDQLADGAQIARNRSHSNIDTVHQAAMSSYLYQAHDRYLPSAEAPQPHYPYQRHSDRQLNRTPSRDAGESYRQHQGRGLLMRPLGASEFGTAVSSSNVLYPVNPGSSLNLAHQRRLSDSAQYQLEAGFPAAAPLQQQRLSSIITTYAQKQAGEQRKSLRQSSDDLDDNDSSSASELDNGQPTGGLKGRQQGALSAGGAAYEQQQQQQWQSHTAPISIPSVSVSEFSQAVRRQSIQQQQIFAQDNQITPMQINVAIEQVIQQQQQHEQQRQLLSTADGQLLALATRRGSSGRALPRIPGEQQSRSLLELSQGRGAGHQLQAEAAGSGQHASQPGAAQPAGQFDGQTRLDLPLLSPTIRRASAPEGQNIKIVVDDMDHLNMGKPGHHFAHHHQSAAANSKYYAQHDYYQWHILCRDDSLDPDGLHVGRGFGLAIMGGKLDAEGQLQACVTWVLPGGPADKVGLREGDQIIEWDGKCLLGMSYEQVAEVIESSANVAELLVRPAPRRPSEPQQAPASYLRSQRRLSHQTERDLMRRESNRAAGQPGAEVAAAAKRAGTGRKLPQIPKAELQAGGAPAHLRRPQPAFHSARHASTGQLDQSLLSSLPLLLAQNQQRLALNGSTSSQLSGAHLSAISRQQQQHQQSRSASELHRANLGAALSTHTPPYITTTGAPHDHTLFASSGTDGSSWYSQPYGGSQQAMAMASYQSSAQLAPLGGGGGGLQCQQTHFGGSQLHSLGPQAGPDEPSGLIGLQVSVDEHAATLEISVLAAHNIERNPAFDYYVRVKILPESSRFKVCTTQPSSDLNWKETFLFQNFPTQNVQHMALEISIWKFDEAPRLSTQMAQPICEALIPIQSARERNIDFWPLRPPPSSPQTRRKSLNDLIGGEHWAGRQQQLQQAAELDPRPVGQLLSAGCARPAQAAVGRPLHADTPRPHQPGEREFYQRERSSSNRNLPDANKLQAQPRRASDEVAASSSRRLVARVSPAASRRSISAMNVGDGHFMANGPAAPRPAPGSRHGSQANIFKAAQQRRDSSSQQHPHKRQGSSSNASPNKFSSCSLGPGSGSRASESSQTPAPAAFGHTPAGRRSSLTGIQSMSGYRSQRSSASDATEHESPLAGKRAREQAGGQPLQPAAPAAESKQLKAGAALARQQRHQQRHQPRQVSSGPSSTRPSCSSNSGSRRGSSERQQPPASFQRRGSFAMQTLRKLKRTMSLTKNDDSPTGSNQDSRRSSDDSSRSASGAEEDLAVSRPLKADENVVGRIKLRFTMTKGQLEVEVMRAAGLKMENLDSASGIYVKTCLKGKSKSNKRKTKLVQHSLEAPTFDQTIKYDGSLVDNNKLLEVSIWTKQAGLRAKSAVGVTEIRLGQLNLVQLQTSWYNLRSTDTWCSSSMDE